MKQSMMGSSKYEFEPERLDEDVADKRKVAEQFRTDLSQVLYSAYRYNDNMQMSDEAKREILVEVHKEFLKRMGHINENN